MTKEIFIDTKKLEKNTYYSMFVEYCETHTLDITTEISEACRFYMLNKLKIDVGAIYSLNGAKTYSPITIKNITNEFVNMSNGNRISIADFNIIYSNSTEVDDVLNTLNELKSSTKCHFVYNNSVNDKNKEEKKEEKIVIKPTTDDVVNPEDFYKDSMKKTKNDYNKEDILKIFNELESDSDKIIERIFKDKDLISKIENTNNKTIDLTSMFRMDGLKTIKLIKNKLYVFYSGIEDDLLKSFYNKVNTAKNIDEVYMIKSSHDSDNKINMNFKLAKYTTNKTLPNFISSSKKEISELFEEIFDERCRFEKTYDERIIFTVNQDIFQYEIFNVLVDSIGMYDVDFVNIERIV